MFCRSIIKEDNSTTSQCEVARNGRDFCRHGFRLGHGFDLLVAVCCISAGGGKKFSIYELRF